jgi:acetyl-CoA carboxylase carboxyltransferase component
MASTPHNRQTDAALLATSRSGHRKPPRQKAPETYDEKLAQLHELRAAALHSAPEAEEKQHARGKYTARERVEKLPSKSSTRSCATARTTSTCRRTGRGATRW